MAKLAQMASSYPGWSALPVTLRWAPPVWLLGWKSLLAYHFTSEPLFLARKTRIVGSAFLGSCEE